MFAISFGVGPPYGLVLNARKDGKKYIRLLILLRLI